MHFQLDIAEEDDFPALITAEWHAFENPLQRIFRLYSPIVNNDRAQSIADSTARQLTDNKTQDDDRKTQSYWIKVTDPETHAIVGGAQWIFITEHSSEHEDDVSSLAARHPAGGARVFATQAFQILADVGTVNRRKLSRDRSYVYAYASLGSCFTIPEYRYRGVGGLLMRWGLKRVDECGMDAWIEAAPSAVPFYERHGFVQKEVLQLDPRRPEELSGEEAEEWDAAAREVLPVGVCIMHRPARNGCTNSE
ncbi:hypothetical protein BDV28DRAFT_147155 [Aspergillus coremiiformis]|uniref:N-acetyltransferase domain-containing protein n=1 Tax=Aspergillus coremiiformis TaxID=138285 RepID=A0A5N6Z9U3_9EURO|nr:hypothetical protein BDV28DRAFT_147155 [Aspergillus coremiiformis]